MHSSQSGECGQRLGQEGRGRDSEGGRDWGWWAETRAEWAETGAGRGGGLRGRGLEETGWGAETEAGRWCLRQIKKRRGRTFKTRKNQRKTEE